MGIIVLIIAVVLEASLAVYCNIKKSNQKRIRSYVRIGTFVAFVIFTLASVIQWSFRWKLLAILLLIWAIIGSVSLMRKKADKKAYKNIRMVFKSIGTLLMVFIAVIPAFMFPQYELPAMSGTYDIDTIVYSYTDDNRIEAFSDTGENRKVNVEFWYPQNADATYPLVVFSHGAFGIRASNTSTYMELASNGYVVCAIDHPYHAMYTIDEGGNTTTVDTSFIQEVNGVNNGVYNEEIGYEFMQKWMEIRTQDMNFVLDTIIENAKDANADAVYQYINIKKIGLFGHSLGGAASAQVGREREDIGGVINLDGDLLGEYVDFVGGEYVMNDEVYPVPILNVYTDDMMQAFADSAALGYVETARGILDTSANAHEVYITGTNHMSLTDLPLFSPFLVSMICNSVNIGGGVEADKYYIIETMNSIVLEFFDSYLKDKGNFDPEEIY